ncbi:MAG: hypothetical protein J7K53_13320 [Bacteroidales bacterium]|nr:hypothetical protein [Bacteroidales bacterium]
MIDKNGFPKFFGLLLIFMLISLLCFVQCIFNETVSAKTTNNNNLPGIELGAVIQSKTLLADEILITTTNKHHY